MSKKKITTHKFYVVDLVRKKPPTKFIEIPVYRVDIAIAFPPRPVSCRQP